MSNYIFIDAQGVIVNRIVLEVNGKSRRVLRSPRRRHTL